MSKNCILIPVHWAKINWFISFLQSIQLKRAGLGMPDFDIVLAASNRDEAMKLGHLPLEYTKRLRIRAFCVDEMLAVDFGSDALNDYYRHNRNQSIVTIKKIAGMKWALQAGYETILSIDSDVLAWSDLDGLFPCAKHNYDKNIYYARRAHVGVCARINADCFTSFKPDDIGSLMAATDDGQLYSWFFDAPCYRAADLQAFFDYMASYHGSLAKWMTRFTSFSFEHLYFQFFRTLYQSSRLVEIPVEEIQVHLEAISAPELAQIGRKYDYRPVWIAAERAMSMPEVTRTIPGLHLLLHFDRFY